MKHIRNGTRWPLDLILEFVRPNEDAHAEPSNHLGVARLGANGDVALAEAVRGPPEAFELLSHKPRCRHSVFVAIGYGLRLVSIF